MVLPEMYVPMSPTHRRTSISVDDRARASTVTAGGRYPPDVTCRRLAAQLELSQSKVFCSVRQDRIDRAELAGTFSGESAELRVANHRISCGGEPTRVRSAHEGPDRAFRHVLGAPSRYAAGAKPSRKRVLAASEKRPCGGEGEDGHDNRPAAAVHRDGRAAGVRGTSGP